MTDLVSRLLEAITQTEKIAREATSGPWEPSPLAELEKGCRCLSCYDDPWAWEIDRIDGPDSGDCGHPMHIGFDDAEHIARHDPAAVLRRCAADRKIVAECRGLSSGVFSGSTVGALGDLVLSLLAEGYGVREDPESE